MDTTTIPNNQELLVFGYMIDGIKQVEDQQNATYLISVNLLVLFKVGARAELLAAEFAWERFFTCVYALMTNQV